MNLNILEEKLHIFVLPNNKISSPGFFFAAEQESLHQNKDAAERCSCIFNCPPWTWMLPPWTVFRTADTLFITARQSASWATQRDLNYFCWLCLSNTCCWDIIYTSAWWRVTLLCPREDLLNPFRLTWIYIHLVKRVFRKESKMIGQTLHHSQEGQRDFLFYFYLI